MAAPRSEVEERRRFISSINDCIKDWNDHCKKNPFSNGLGIQDATVRVELFRAAASILIKARDPSASLANLWMDVSEIQMPRMQSSILTANIFTFETFPDVIDHLQMSEFLPYSCVYSSNSARIRWSFWKESQLVIKLNSTSENNPANGECNTANDENRVDTLRQNLLKHGKTKERIRRRALRRQSRFRTIIKRTLSCPEMSPRQFPFSPRVPIGTPRVSPGAPRQA